MFTTIMIYGVIAGAVAIASITVGLTIGVENGGSSVLVGYLIMLAALSLIFVAVKRYRDTRLGGVIRFNTACGMGVAIALVAGVTYVIGWEIYLWQTHYTFMDEYARAHITTLQASGATAAELSVARSDLAIMARNYAKPLNRMVMTIFEILPVGAVIALVSAALLRRSNFLPARHN